MTEGINMGRKSPWSKEEYISVYKKANEYGAKLASRLLLSEGVDSAAEARMAYSIYKCPVVYLFVHYHYGRIEDLMSDTETSVYLMMFLPKVKYFAKELRNAYASGQAFPNDTSNMGSILAKMCDEILYIEENF